jgi:hypothetical protein
MSYSPHELLQGQKAAPQARFLGAHRNLEVALQVSRAIQRQPQEVDGFRAPSAAFTRVSLREPTKLDQLVLVGSRVRPNFPNRRRIGVLNTNGVRSILEADHKVIDIAHQPGFTPQPALHHAFEPEVENVMKVKVAQKHTEYSPYAKGNFTFDRVICDWRTGLSVIDLRLKK